MVFLDNPMLAQVTFRRFPDFCIIELQQEKYRSCDSQRASTHFTQTKTFFLSLLYQNNHSTTIAWNRSRLQTNQCEMSLVQIPSQTTHFSLPF
uniref:Ovule protein n=1 Tax=Ditylenchus dipsaci TaxID=166011 RepID=A0A915D6Q9_9BILA